VGAAVRKAGEPAVRMDATDGYFAGRAILGWFARSHEFAGFVVVSDVRVE